MQDEAEANLTLQLLPLKDEDAQQRCKALKTLRGNHSLSDIESDKLSTESNVLLGSSGRSYQDGYHIDLLTAIDNSDSMRRTAVKITLVKMKVDLNSSDYKKLITP